MPNTGMARYPNNLYAVFIDSALDGLCVAATPRLEIRMGDADWLRLWHELYADDLTAVAADTPGLQHECTLLTSRDLQP